MKITTFNPQIITKDAEAVAKLFEELGFERRHNPKGIGELDIVFLTIFSLTSDHCCQAFRYRQNLFNNWIHFSPSILYYCRSVVSATVPHAWPYALLFHHSSTFPLN